MTLISYLHNKAKMLRPSGTHFPAGHFYSPYPNLKDIEVRREAIFDRSRKDLPGIDLREAQQIALVETIASEYYDEFPYLSDGGVNRFSLANRNFSYGDAVVLYGMLRYLEPRRVIEIGSGHSSALMLDVNESFLGGSIAFTFIEPFPKLLKNLTMPGDLEKNTMIASPLHEVEQHVFGELEAGDLLFVDSTHVSKAGSDVNRIFFEILPSLKRGTYIQIHDIFFPFEYPETWIQETRAWNEGYLVRAFLQNNPNYEIVLFNSFLGIHYQDELGKLLPLATENDGGSLWLKKIGDD